MQRALFLVVALVFAGCATPDVSPASVDATNASVEFAEDYAFENATIPREELQNASLGAEHEHDAWGAMEELVLVDESFPAGMCEDAFDALAYAVAVDPSYGCARLGMPEGVIVPEGTGELRVEIDASDALKAGSMAFQWRNKAREEEAEVANEPVHTWSLPLTSVDWDIPHAPATTFVMYVAARGPGGVLDGELKARIVAVKQPGWVPLLAVAHVDHWKLPQLHDLAAPGVMRLADAEATVTNIDPDRFLGEAEHGGVELVDIIAPGTRWVTVVADTTSSDCAPVLQCWFVPQLHVGGFDRDRFGTLLFEDGARRVYVWSVPDEVPYDSVYADVSTTEIEPRIDACAAGDAQGPSCGLVSLASTTATARVQAFAWQGDVDVEQLKALADA